MVDLFLIEIFLISSLFGRIVSIDCFESTCLECSSEEYGNCTKCMDGFNLVGGSCICYDPNCVECSSSTITGCTKCKDSFLKIDGECLKYNYCYIHGETKCEQCQEGYIWNETIGHCVKDTEGDQSHCYDENCFLCYNSKQGTCVQCKQDYILEGGECKTKCVPKTELEEVEVEINGKNERVNTTISKCICNGVESDIDNCLGDCALAGCTNLFYSPCENPCLFCYLFQLYEDPNCKADRGCDDPNCESCLNSKAGNCYRCKLGYFLIYGKCEKINVENCLSSDFSTDPDKCSICQNHYDLIDGKCVFNETSLELYPSNIRPEPEPIDPPEDPVDPEDPTKPEPEPEPCNFTNCAKCSGGKCISCISGYELKLNQCNPKCGINNCAYCNTPNNCTKCYNDFELTSENECKMVCKDPNCESCFPSTYCKQCSPEYKLEYGKCIKQCNVDNCSYCSSPNVCFQCNSQYFLNGDKCTKCADSACSSCYNENYNGCKTCKYGYTLIDGECAKNCPSIEHCRYCSSLSLDNCIQCEDNYELNNGQCLTKKKSYVYLIIILILVVIIMGITVYSYCSRKKRRETERMMMQAHMQELARMQRGNPHMMQASNIALAAGASDATGRVLEAESINVQPREPVLSKEERIEKYSKEFDESLENCQEKVHGLCAVCNKEPGKYVADCGCKLCKHHSKLTKINKNEGEIQEEEEGDLNKCPACGKIIKKIKSYKLTCGICMSEKKDLASFKCNCALTVCRNCYIKCRFMNPTCPACRAPLE